MANASQSTGWPCLICGQEGLDEMEMSSHMLAVHQLSEISCPMCDFGGVTADDMTKHINACHLDALSPTKPSECHQASRHNSAARVNNCAIKTTEGNETNRVMVETDMESLFTCPMCTDFVSDSPEVLTLHVNQYHFSGDHQSVLVPVQSTVLPSHTGASTSIQDESNWKSSVSGNPDSSGTMNTKKPSSSVSRDFSSKGSASNRNNAENKENVLMNDVKGENTSENVLQCPVCGDVVKHRITLEFHLKEAHPKFKGSFTQAAASSVSTNDVRRENMSENVLHCPVCDAVVKHGITLEFHLQQAHPEFDGDVIDKEGLLLFCPVCGDPAADPSSLQKHVDNHFIAEDLKASTSGDSQLAQELERREKQASIFKQQKLQGQSQNGASKQKATASSQGRGRSSNAKKNADIALNRGQTSMLDFYARQNNSVPFPNKTGVDDGGTASKGVIERIRAFYSIPNKFITGFWLVSPTDHYCGSYMDRGWGCGYRNFQMMLSCLVKHPDYKRVVFNGKTDIPSVPKIQKLIEEAWARGFDPQGKEQLNGKLCNTRKWIGTTEIFAVFSSLKVRCQLVDFYRPTGDDGTHPRLFQWVRDYFREGGFRPPLYLQHQGHSRSIVGVEENKDGTLKLVLFDPGTPRSQMQQFLRKDITPQLMRVIRRLPSGMKAKQYQILAVRGILNAEEQQEYKLLRSDRIP